MLLRIAAAALAVLLLATGCGQASPGPKAEHSQATSPVPAPPGLAGRYHHYVALGDSYTAAPYVPHTDPDDPCLRSSHNYPSLIAASLGIGDVSDRSCGGATTGDMTRPQFSGTPPQFDALKADTDLVTVGIGGNDAKIAQTLLGSCPALAASSPHGSPCKKAVEQHGPDLLLGAIPMVGRRMSRLLAEVHRRSPHADVVAVGYPRVAPARGTCGRLAVTAGDAHYVNRVLHTLDRALRRATEKAGDTWVDLWQPSRGHDICSADPWVNGHQPDPRRAAAYHPFEREQRAVARLVMRALAGTAE